VETFSDLVETNQRFPIFRHRSLWIDEREKRVSDLLEANSFVREVSEWSGICRRNSRNVSIVCER
jgi:hypothetical protein